MQEYVKVSKELLHDYALYRVTRESWKSFFMNMPETVVMRNHPVTQKFRAFMTSPLKIYFWNNDGVLDMDSAVVNDYIMTHEEIENLKIDPKRSILYMVNPHDGKIRIRYATTKHEIWM